MRGLLVAAVVEDGVRCTVAEGTWMSLSELAKDASRMHKVRTRPENESETRTSKTVGPSASDGVLHY